MSDLVPDLLAKLRDAAKPYGLEVALEPVGKGAERALRERRHVDQLGDAAEALNIDKPAADLEPGELAGAVARALSSIATLEAEYAALERTNTRLRRTIAEGKAVNERLSAQRDQARAALHDQSADRLDRQHGDPPAAAPSSSQAPPPPAPPRSPRGHTVPPVDPADVLEAVATVTAAGNRATVTAIGQAIGLTKPGGTVSPARRDRLCRAIGSLVAGGALTVGPPYKRGGTWRLPAGQPPPTTDEEHVATRRPEVQAAAQAVTELENATDHPAPTGDGPVTNGPVAAYTNPRASVEATVEGRVLRSISTEPGTLTELARRLDIPRRDIARAVVKLDDEGEIDYGARRYRARNPATQ